MVSKKTIAVTGMAAWLVTYLLSKTNSATRQREAKQHRKQVTTWEGEGGNLPPSQPLQGQSAQEHASQIHPSSHHAH